MNKENNISKLDRRRFIKKAGAATLVVGLSSQASTVSASGKSGEKKQFDYDTIVIGGGFAGVTAARDLQENGYSCTILEARNRLGGRTFYAPYGDTKVELGGTWIHWMQPFVWAEVMRYGLDIIETPGATAERIIQLKNGKAFEPEISEVYSDLFAGGQLLTDKAREVYPRPFDLNYMRKNVLDIEKYNIHELLQQLDLTDSQRSIFERLLAGTSSAATTSIAASEALRIFALCGHNIGTYFDVNTRYQLKDGTIALINKMIDDGKPEVKLGVVVKRVEQKPDHVVLKTNSGEIFTARTVVCTAPLNVLKDIEFAPAIHPHKLAASKEGHPGRGFKVFAQVKGEIPNALLYGDENEAIDDFFTYHVGKENSLIVGFGYERSNYDTKDEEQLQATLRKYLPDIEVTGSFGYDWDLDPYSQGTWCLWRPGWNKKYGEGLRDGPEGRVFFASSDFCEGTRGYIDGAIGSGSKAAQQISELLG